MSTAPSRPGVVPHIASWSAENLPKNLPEPVIAFAGVGGIAYPDETPEDRDDRGVLWRRQGDAQGEGKAQYGKVHGPRQREVMHRLLCQVCGGPADRDDRGMLWLLEDNRTDWKDWPENLLTAHPPVCLPCARQAVVDCPHLLKGSVAVRVAASDVCAVYGMVYSPAGLRPMPLHLDVVAYGGRMAPWVLAGQLVRGLNGCTIVDLRAELDGRH
ncbi:hypothetical protein DMA15_12790 [Streptomyces sp. WAC 01529]|uniref:hypothetical protein n=1 Tax=Streptomyces sp. WAC 01529 TaxID=2203205 RepID=UPI000F71C3A6|nr:hypothetical protein [Streptomyces sp. WAC 01529]AZM53351.1 hypothetical protein DMA15_12790 [Streptomyces sp. WAC 01529]